MDSPTRSVLMCSASVVLFADPVALTANVGETNKADAGQCDQWSPRVHREGTQGFTKAGLTTKGTKTSITYSCLAHWWDTKSGSMKPPTKDWSSEHQSPRCKSSLFQTSGVLIQTHPRGELLVRNQYSSWGVLWPTLCKHLWSLKSISMERVEKFIHTNLCRPARWASYATAQSSKQVHCPKVTFKDTSALRAVFISDQSSTASSLMFPIWVRVVNGNMINNHTNTSSLHSIHHKPCSPSPCPVTL